MMKLDFDKGCDVANQVFLLKVLARFCLDKEWIEWLGECINTSRILVLFNGICHDFFVAGRPTFPLLIHNHGWSLGEVDHNDGHWKCIKVVDEVGLVSHLQFVVDTYLMGEVSEGKTELLSLLWIKIAMSALIGLNWESSCHSILGLFLQPSDQCTSKIIFLFSHITSFSTEFKFLKNH